MSLPNVIIRGVGEGLAGHLSKTGYQIGLTISVPQIQRSVAHLSSNSDFSCVKGLCDTFKPGMGKLSSPCLIQPWFEDDWT